MTRLRVQYRAILFWKGVDYAGLILFTVIMPRQMQPASYGRFAALLSLIGLLTMASTMGAQATFGRFVPEYEARGEHDRTRALFSLMFILRAIVAGALAVALLLFFPRVLPGATPAMATAGTAAFLSVALAMVCYQLMYGLNQLGRSLVHDSLIKVVLVASVLASGSQRNVDRAAVMLFLSEFGFLLLGLMWARRYFVLREAAQFRTDLPAQLRFGLAFFGASLLLMAVWRGGELAVLYLSGSSSEVAYYSIANAVALAVSSLLGQFVVLLLPTLINLDAAGQKEKMEILLGQALKYLTICAFAFLIAMHALGTWLVERVLGTAYQPVVANLQTLALGLLPVALLRTAMAVAMVRNASRPALIMAACGVAAFVAFAAVLVPATGSRGASLAAAIAVAITAAVGAAQFALWPVMRAARFGRLTASGVLAALLFVLPQGSELALGIGATAVFIGSLFLSGVVSAAEVRHLARSLGP